MKKFVMVVIMVMVMLGTACAEDIAAVVETPTDMQSNDTAVETEAPAAEHEPAVVAENVAEDPVEAEINAEPVEAEEQEATPTEEQEATPAEEQEATPAEEQEATPAEEQEAAEEENIAEDAEIEEMTDTEAKVIINVRFVNGNRVHLGDEVTVEAAITGLEQVAYSMQWQYFDGKDWHDVNGATNSHYTFVADAENVSYIWQIVVTTAE